MIRGGFERAIEGEGEVGERRGLLMATNKSGVGCEAAVGSLTASKKREYKVSNRLHEGKRPLYAIAFNFIDARYYDVFATVGGNRVLLTTPSPPPSL